MVEPVSALLALGGVGKMVYDYFASQPLAAKIWMTGQGATTAYQRGQQHATNQQHASQIQALTGRMLRTEERIDQLELRSTKSEQQLQGHEARIAAIESLIQKFRSLNPYTIVAIGAGTTACVLYCVIIDISLTRRMIYALSWMSVGAGVTSIAKYGLARCKTGAQPTTDSSDIPEVSSPVSSHSGSSAAETVSPLASTPAPLSASAKEISLSKALIDMAGAICIAPMVMLQNVHKRI